MKRLLLSALVSLLACISINAQDIVGKWTTSVKQNSKEGVEMDASTTKSFTRDGKFKTDLVIDVKERDEKGSSNVIFKIKISCSGTWSISNSILTEQIDGKSLVSEVIDYTEERPKMIMNMIRNSCSSEIKKASKKPSHGRIESLTDNELKVKDIDKDDSTVITYKRQ